MAALDRISIAAIGDTPADLAEQAGSAEAAGIDCVWAPELFRSSVTQATWLAAKTEKVEVGTGIAWAFTRSAFILAVSALDIDEMAGGRFRLGLGAGVKRLNETWHSVDYGKPAPHLRETIEATRLIMEKASSGEPIRYEGAISTSRSRAGSGPTSRFGSGSRSMPRRCGRGCAGWRATSPTA